MIRRSDQSFFVTMIYSIKVLGNGYIGYRFCFISGNVDCLWSRNCLLPRKLHVQARLFGLNHQTVAGDRVSGGDRGDYPVSLLLLLLLLLLLPLLLVVVY